MKKIKIEEAQTEKFIKDLEFLRNEEDKKPLENSNNKGEKGKKGDNKGEKEDKGKKEDKGGIFRKIAKTAIYVLVFLLPLFFLPWTNNVLEFNKQTLLFILIFISLICWLLNCLISNKLEINLSFLNFPVIVLLLISGLSVIFSVSRYGSFWGLPLPISSSFLSLLCFVSFYFLIANLFKKKDTLFLFLTLFVSGFFAALFFILQVFGKFIFPFDFAKIASFNTIGTVNSLAIYFSLLLILTLSLFFFVNRLFKIIFGIFAFFLLFCLLLINSKISWLILLFGAAVLFVFSAIILKRVGKQRFITFIMVFLAIALFFTVFRFSLPGAPAIPADESSLSQKTGIEILRHIPITTFILGSGPGTFTFNWSKYKSSDFWADRFGTAPSEILERIITTGVLGILALFLLVFVFLKPNLDFLLKKIDKEGVRDYFLGLGIFAAFIALIFGFFLYPANLSISMLFWLLVGSRALIEKEEKKIWSLSASLNKGLILSFVFVLILVLGFGISVLYFQGYLAEVRYFQGIKAWQRGDNISSTNYISQAVNFNPKMDFYQRDLSQIYLIRLKELLLRTDLSQQEMISQAQSLIAGAVNSASQATRLDLNNVANWAVRGFVYRNIIGISGGADDWAIKSYQKALELEPANPYFLTEIGRVYLARFDLLSQQQKEAEARENIGLARENFEKAISLKSNYAPAHFQIAMIYIREGKIQEAIDKLELTKQAAPSDTGLLFQLGLLYYNNNQLEKAKAELETTVLLDPNYSNARYYLGLIYDRERNREQAIVQFERIEQFNPDNQEVKKILTNLRTGKSALEGIVPTQPPIEEKTPEKLKK